MQPPKSHSNNAKINMDSINQTYLEEESCNFPIATSDHIDDVIITNYKTNMALVNPIRGKPKLNYNPTKIINHQ